MRLFSLAVISTALFLAGCEDPAANKPKATTTDTNTTTRNTNIANTANANTNAAPTAAKGEALAITAENSKVEFTGSKVTGKHDGGFKAFSGTIDLVNSKPEESSVTVDIDATSVFSDNDGLTDHLKSPDFFDTAKFPKAGFKSTKLVAGATAPANYTVTGDLDLHGQVKSITFPAKIDVSADGVTVTAEFSINRKDFGIVYAGKADDLIRDDVVIRLNLKTDRKK